MCLGRRVPGSAHPRTAGGHLPSTQHSPSQVLSTPLSSSCHPPVRIPSSSVSTCPPVSCLLPSASPPPVLPTLPLSPITRRHFDSRLFSSAIVLRSVSPQTMRKDWIPHGPGRCDTRESPHPEPFPPFVIWANRRAVLGGGGCWGVAGGGGGGGVPRHFPPPLSSLVSRLSSLLSPLSGILSPLLSEICRSLISHVSSRVYHISHLQLPCT